MIIQANFTPIPAGWDTKTNKCKVLIHISFVKKDDSGVFIKIPFTDYQDIKEFALSGMCQTLSINLSTTLESTKVADIEIIKPDENYWKLLNYSSQGKLESIFENKAKVDRVENDLKKKSEENKKKIKEKENEVNEIKTRILAIKNNIGVYDKLITELDIVIRQLQPEIDRINSRSTIQGKLNEYSIKKADYIKDRDKQNKAIVGENTQLTAAVNELAKLNADAKRINDAQKVIIDFKNHKRISDDQDKAVNYINDYLQGRNTNSFGTRFTSEVDELNDPLSLSDVLGYFSGYSEFQKRLGLLFEVNFTLLPNQRTNHTGVLEINCTNVITNNINSSFYKVHYVFKENGYFYPESLEKDKYRDGYLNLCHQRDNTPVYDLLQNSFEEIQYRGEGKSNRNDKDSDYTSGFYLVQNGAKDELDIPEIKSGNELFLEHLVVGYRVDLKRNNYTWKSLHKRDYSFHFGNQILKNITNTDEGFISSNSVTKAFELVSVYEDEDELKAPGPLDLSRLEPEKTYNFTAIVNEQVDPIQISVKISNQNAYIVESPNKVIITLIKTEKVLKDDALKKFINQVNVTLKDAFFINKWVQCDNVGRLYYKGFVEDPTKPRTHIPSYLPSSLICHINGYSLSVPKYMGKKLNDFFDPNKKTDTDKENKSFLGLERFMEDQKIELSFKTTANSLPILRIGDQYKVRCRLTILGGVSLPLEDTNNSCAIEKKFKRQDPIQAPRLLLPQEYEKDTSLYGKMKAIGDTESQIIIRQDNDNKYSLIATRIIAPPSIPWQMAEWLKMMDNGDVPDPALMERTRDTKMPKYIETGYQHEYKFEDNDKKIHINKVPIVRWKAGTGKFGKYATASDHTPYIVDNMANYFIIVPSNLYSLSKVSGIDFSKREEINRQALNKKEVELNALQNTFANKFRKAQCNFWGKDINKNRKADKSLALWKLVVQQGKYINVKVNTKERLITIYVTPGDDIEFVMRCYTLDEGQLNSLYYVQSDDSESDTAKRKNKVKLGENPQGRAVVLAENKFRVIYALQQPWNPQLEDLPKAGSLYSQQFKPSRSPLYPKDVVMTQGVYYTGRTCNEVYLMADWQEIIDDLNINDEKALEANDGSPLRILHHHKKVFDYSEPGFYASRTNQQSKPELSPEKIPSPLLIEETDKDIKKRIYADLEGTNLHFRHELGSTSFHSIKYYITGVSRFRHYYKNQNDADFYSLRTPWFKNAKNNVEYALEATKAPLPPVVAYIIPLFTSAKKGDTTLNAFGGLRIYLKRPWYSSGYGEQLGVVLSAVDKTSKESDYTSHISQFGRDITTAGFSPDLHTYVAYNDKINENDQYFLPLTDDKSLQVNIAAYPVYFDKIKMLWFADIAFKNEELRFFYCPFVRLVICRFQKFAVSGKELSLPIACDFMQIYPDRTVTLKSAEMVIVIDAPTIKMSQEGLLSEVYYWGIENDPVDISNGGFLFNEPEINPENATYKNGQFIIEYKQGHKAVIIREYELFSNTDDIGQKTIFGGRRLLYSHVINLLK